MRSLGKVYPASSVRPAAWGVPPEQGQFFDLGAASLDVQHELALRDVGALGGWQVFINGTPRLPDLVDLREIQWMTVFNENYNESNSQCDPMRVFYRQSSHVLDLSQADPQFHLCMLGNQFNWEVHWITEPSLCDIHFQPPPPPPADWPGFPASPVIDP